MAYSPPIKDTVVIVGGLGTQANKNSKNGGGATKTAWDNGSPSDFIGTNGDAIAVVFSATISNNGSDKVRISGAGSGENFINVANGTLVNCIFTGSVYDDGIYEIIDDNNPSDDSIDIELSYINSNPIVDCYVGGTLATLQEALDNNVNDASSYNRFIYDNIATETILNTIDFDTYGGSSSSTIFVRGYDSTLEAEAEVIITTNETLSNGLIEIGAISYINIKNFDFNGGGKDSSKAAFGLFCATSSADYITISNCKFRGASSDGATVLGTGASYWRFINCESYLNGSMGFDIQAGAAIVSICSIHDNDSHGVRFNYDGHSIINSLLYDNGGDGLNIFSGTDSIFVIGNTSYGNTSDGFSISPTSTSISMINNASVGNGGYGFNFGGTSTYPIAYFSYNLASINTSGHYDLGDDSSFINFKDGNNKNSSQVATDIFTSVTDGSENFTPKVGSDLINNGLEFS